MLNDNKFHKDEMEESDVGDAGSHETEHEGDLMGGTVHGGDVMRIESIVPDSVALASKKQQNSDAIA